MDVYATISRLISSVIEMENCRSQKARVDYVRSIIVSLGCGYVYQDDEHFELFVMLIRPFGWEVDYFSIVPNRINRRTMECQAHLANGKLEVFSWVKAASGRVDTDHCKLMKKMRTAIVPDILHFKRDAICCVECGSVESLQVDHVNPFREISADYIRLKGCEVDDEWVSGWILYHKSHASLQILCASCNYRKH